MLPDFNELIAFKDLKFKLSHRLNPAVKSIVPGNHHSPLRGQGLEFDSVREYVPGSDDIRNIDWRVTARTGSPHLKLFKEDRERRIVLCVDMNASMRFGTKKTFKSVQAARVAAILGWLEMSNHNSISACLFGDVPKGLQFFPPTRTKKSFCMMLKLLSQPPIEQHQIPLNDVLSSMIQGVQTGSLIYVISDFMDSEQNLQLEASVRSLNKIGNVIFISINDPADQALFPVGLIKCSNQNKEKIDVNTESLRGRTQYEEQWIDNRKHLHAMLSRCKVPLIELSTESDIRRDLMVGLL